MFSWMMMRTPSTNFLICRAGFLLLIAAVALILPPSTGNVIAATADVSFGEPFAWRGPVLAQDSDSNDETGVSPDQLEKYVAVYRAMQLDRGLTVESAAAKQSLTLSQFRELEQKVERDDVAREQVREELQKAATASPSATSTAAPGKH
jgi:hypothetical protein